MNKEEYLKAIDKLENEYDAYFMGNRYGSENTHQKEFELLSNLKCKLVGNALVWIRNCYDCYYKDELPDDNAFNYLRGIVNESN